MSISDDVDVELLISRLAGPLLPPDREAFRRAAEDAIQKMPCRGEGAAYRVVSVLQRAFFVPPMDTGSPFHQRRSKLIDKPAIEYGGDDPRHPRYRKNTR